MIGQVVGVLMGTQDRSVALSSGGGFQEASKTIILFGGSHRGGVFIVIGSVLDQVRVRKVFAGDLGFTIADGVQTPGTVVAVVHLKLFFALVPLNSGWFSGVVVESCQFMGFNTGLVKSFGEHSPEVVIIQFLNVVFALFGFDSPPQSIIFYICSFLVFVIDLFQFASVVVLVVGCFVSCSGSLFETSRLGVGVVRAFAVIITLGDCEVTVLSVVDPLGDGFTGFVFKVLPGGHDDFPSGIVVGVFDGVLATVIWIWKCLICILMPDPKLRSRRDHMQT